MGVMSQLHLPAALACTAKWLGLVAVRRYAYLDPHMGTCGLANNRSGKPHRLLGWATPGVKGVARNN